MRMRSTVVSIRRGTQLGQLVEHGLKRIGSGTGQDVTSPPAAATAVRKCAGFDAVGHHFMTR